VPDTYSLGVAVRSERLDRSLDYSPKLARGYWRLRLYPDAGEAVATFQSAAGASSFGSAGGSGALAAAAEPDGSPVADDNEPPDGSAERRARRRVRLYCASNRLTYLWTLTYSGDGQRNPRAVRDDVHKFFQGLRLVIGRPYPYLWVTEWHPGGHGLHVHFALGEYVPHQLVVRTWGRGEIVWVRGPRKELDDEGARKAGRRIAGYVAKYLTKDPSAPRGWHRYEVAQNFQPSVRELTAETAEEAVRLADAALGDGATWWDSADDASWPWTHTLAGRWP
jgi:hypothetical protein